MRFPSGLDAQGRLLMGGDVAASRMHLRATPGEQQLLASQGRVGEVATLRAMARITRPAGSQSAAADQALVELKAVDANYPLVGELVLERVAATEMALSRRPSGRFGVAVDPYLLQRLGAGVGDRLAIGNGEFEVASTIVAEPDKLAGQAAFGPRVLMSMEALEASGLLQPGSLTRWTYRLLLPAEKQASG